MMLFFAIAIVIRIFYIQNVKGDELRAMSQKAHTRTEILPADRGNIISEDGQLLSSTKPQFDIRIDFKAINKDTFQAYVGDLADSLAGLFRDKSPSVYETELKTAFKEEKRYYLLKKGIPYYEYQSVRAFPIFEKGQHRGGFIVEPKSKRENPYQILAYRTIGLWRENAANVGLESAYDTALAGKEGSRVLRKTAGNVWIPVRGSEYEPVNGRDIVTTIDIEIQEVAENALMQTLQQYGCQWGAVIVMETATGKIKALANLGRQKDGSYWEDKNYALEKNEPGSTFKLMSLYALIEEGHVKVDDMTNAFGGIKYFGKQRVRDDHLGMSTISVKNAFAKSSNVVFANLVATHFKDDPMRYIKRLQKLHLHEKTGIDLKGETTPLIKTTKSKSWNNVTSLPWIGYGYESLITPLHTCMVYNAVANNGKLMKPYLVSRILDYGQVVKQYEPVVLEESIGSPETIRQLKEAMREVVVSGTGKRVQSPYYNAAGKTGTAQVADGVVSYADGVKQGSFVGFFPYENPKYTIAVLVRSVPGGAYYGGVVAAPVFKTIADKLYAAHIGGWKLPEGMHTGAWTLKSGIPGSVQHALNPLGIHTETSGQFGIAYLSGVDQNRAQVSEWKVDGKVIPNVRGMGLKDAVYILENIGLKVKVNGFGTVQGQSLEPGVALKKGSTILLQLG